MKLEVGQFVRTKDGKIFDCYVSEQMGKPIYYPKRSKTNGYIDWNEVYKKSENIIDILEVRDYVNGCKVIKNTLKDGGNIVIVQGGNCFTNEDIKTVVTKEAFESMEYKLGDK